MWLSIASRFIIMFLALASVLCLPTLSPKAAGQTSTEITGKVVQVNGSEIEIRIDADWLPQIGDPVEVSTQIAGDLAPAGTYAVNRVEGQSVWAQRTGGRGTTDVGYTATIRSNRPRRTSTPPPAPPRVSAEKAVAAPDTGMVEKRDGSIQPQFRSAAGSTLGKAGKSKRIRVGKAIQAAKLDYSDPPVYPGSAKKAGIEGVVSLAAVIGTNGEVQSLEAIEGHPLLLPAAIEAVKNWRYQVTLLNGKPLEVSTQIDVHFNLP